MKDEEERLLLRWVAPDESVWVIMRDQPVASSMVDAAVELIRNKQGMDAPTAPPCAEGQSSSRRGSARRA